MLSHILYGNQHTQQNICSFHLESVNMGVASEEGSAVVPLLSPADQSQQNRTNPNFHLGHSTKMQFWCARFKAACIMTFIAHVALYLLYAGTFYCDSDIIIKFSYTNYMVYGVILNCVALYGYGAGNRRHIPSLMIYSMMQLLASIVSVLVVTRYVAKFLENVPTSYLSIGTCDYYFYGLTLLEGIVLICNIAMIFATIWYVSRIVTYLHSYSERERPLV